MTRHERYDTQHTTFSTMTLCIMVDYCVLYADCPILFIVMLSVVAPSVWHLTPDSHFCFGFFVLIKWYRTRTLRTCIWRRTRRRPTCYRCYRNVCRSGSAGPWGRRWHLACNVSCSNGCKDILCSKKMGKDVIEGLGFFFEVWVYQKHYIPLLGYYFNS